MIRLIISLLCLLFTGTSVAQKHFTAYKKPAYQVLKMKSVRDSLPMSFVTIKRAGGTLTITIRQLESDSSEIVLSRNRHPWKRFVVPVITWYLSEKCEVADLDADGRKDLKFTAGSGGNGLAGEQSWKIYLFDYGDDFMLLSFFDYATDAERDLDGDGVFELISNSHVDIDGHSYWAHNAYRFKNGKLLNVGKKIGYPLLFKHLNRSQTVPANNVSKKRRDEEWREAPDEMISL